MPLYNIDHSTPLSSSQKDALASSITSIHLSKFPLVPAVFVNIIFTDISHKTCYTGGKKRAVNHINARVRLGDRKTQDFQDLSEELEQAWNDVVGAENPLQTVIVQPGNPVGREAGFELPRAGEEKVWLEKYWTEFKKRAGEGDEDFVELVRTVEAKGILK